MKEGIWWSKLAGGQLNEKTIYLFVNKVKKLSEKVQ